MIHSVNMENMKYSLFYWRSHHNTTTAAKYCFISDVVLVRSHLKKVQNLASNYLVTSRKQVQNCLQVANHNIFAHDAYNYNPLRGNMT